jgi:hypothetical protein
MKKVGIGLVILVVVYFMGPHPDAPSLVAKPSWTAIPDSALQIAAFVQSKEAENKEIKPNNEAKIIFADSLHPQKTKYVFLYLQLRRWREIRFIVRWRRHLMEI